MIHFRTLTKLTVLISVFCFMFPQEAHAYLDPGSGSLLIQIILASLLGAMYFLRRYWGKVKAFFGTLESGGNEGEYTENSDEVPDNN
jgi:hypothetical protein